MTEPAAIAKRDRLRCDFEAAVLLIDQARDLLSAGWDRAEMERCAAVLTGAEAILNGMHDDLFPVEGGRREA